MEEIELVGCTKKYIKNNREIIALKKINCKFKKNKLYMIKGNSGSGKSTLINIIAGLIKKDEGKVLYDGKEIINNEDMALVRNKNIGLVYQSFLLNENMTAIENVMLPLFLNNKVGSKERVEKATKMLEKFGLSNRINHYPKELSGGEQQRVAIARALINNPDIVLADEPTGNLDKNNEKYFFNLFQELAHKEKRCVIVVSHNDALEKYADEVIYLKDGILNDNK